MFSETAPKGFGFVRGFNFSMAMLVAPLLNFIAPGAGNSPANVVLSFL